MIDMSVAGAARFTADGFPALLKIAEIGVTRKDSHDREDFLVRADQKPFAIMKCDR
jgi:hypothetical protein